MGNLNTTHLKMLLQVEIVLLKCIRNMMKTTTITTKAHMFRREVKEQRQWKKDDCGYKEEGTIYMQPPPSNDIFHCSFNRTKFRNELQLQHSQSNSYGLPRRSFLAHFALFVCMCVYVLAHTYLLSSFSVSG